MDIEAELWKQVYENWITIFASLRRQLPSKEYLMFNDDGVMVESGRPMEESILADKVCKSKRLFYYMIHIGLIDVPDMKVTEVNGNKIIEVGVKTRFPLGSGGVARKN